MLQITMSNQFELRSATFCPSSDRSIKTLRQAVMTEQEVRVSSYSQRAAMWQHNHWQWAAIREVSSPITNHVSTTAAIKACQVMAPYLTSQQRLAIRSTRIRSPLQSSMMRTQCVETWCQLRSIQASLLKLWASTLCRTNFSRRK